MNIIELRQELAQMNTELRAGLTSGELKADQIKSAQEKAKELRSRIEALELLEQQENGQEHRSEQPSSAFDYRSWAKGDAYETELRAAMATDANNVIPNYDTQIMKLLAEDSVLRQLVPMTTISSNELVKLVEAQRAGVAVVEEGDTRATTDSPVLTKIAISLKELNASPEITQELADFNSFNIESFLIDSLSAQFAEQEAQLFWNGTGADGEPTGLEVDNSITATTTAASGEVDYQDIVNLYYSLGAKYRKNATFVMNSDSQKKLVGLVDADGNPIFATATGGASATLMGRPVVIDDHAADGYWFMDAKRSIVGLGHTSGLRILRNPYRKQGYISFDSGHYFGFGVVDYAGIVNMTIAA